MHSEPFVTHELHRIQRAVDKHESEEEYRQNDHVKKLRDKAPEYLGNLAHIGHKLRGTKLRNIFFSPK